MFYLLIWILVRVFQVFILPLSEKGGGQLKAFKYQRERDPNATYYTHFDTVTNPITFEDVKSEKQSTAQSTISLEQQITISPRKTKSM